MREFRPATWFGEQLLQEWGHWCIQHLEAFGSGGGATAGGDGGERRMTRAAGDYSDPVLAELISTELASELHQTIHLRIADRPAIDRRVAIMRYVGKPMKLDEFGGEPVIWRGEIDIGTAVRPVIEFPEPELLATICVPVEAASLSRELGLTPEQVREATRRLRALAVKAHRSYEVIRRARANENRRRKAA